MNQKIITALASVAAIVAFMAIPVAAQATQVQCGTAECANNAAIRGQSSTFQATTQNPAGAIKCGTTEILDLPLTSNQVPTIDMGIIGVGLSGCTAKGKTAHVSGNETFGEPWQLQIQQPEGSGPGETPGQVTAHITPPTGKSLQFFVEVVEFGFVVAECDFTASTIQLMGNEKVDTWKVSAGTFTLKSRAGVGAAECGTVGTTTADLEGTIQFETEEATPKAVTVDMT